MVKEREGGSGGFCRYPVKRMSIIMTIGFYEGGAQKGCCFCRYMSNGPGPGPGGGGEVLILGLCVGYGYGAATLLWTPLHNLIICLITFCQLCGSLLFISLNNLKPSN